MSPDNPHSVHLSEATQGNISDISVALGNISEVEVVARAVYWFSKMILCGENHRILEISNSWNESVRWSNLPNLATEVIFEKLDARGISKARLLNSTWRTIAGTHIRRIGGSGNELVKQSYIMSEAADKALVRCWRPFPFLRAVELQVSTNHSLARKGISGLVAAVPDLNSLHLRAGWDGQRSEAIPFDVLSELSLETLRLSQFCLCARQAQNIFSKQQLDFRNFRALSSLRIEKCAIDNDICWTFQFMPGLESLELVESNLICTAGEESDVDIMEAFASLGAIGDLKKLVLDGISVNREAYCIQDRHLFHLMNLHKLEELALHRVSNAGLSEGVSSSGISCILGGLNSLTKLDIPDIPITAQILCVISRHTQLRSLTLSGYGPGVAKHSSAIEDLQNLVHLRHLTLNFCDVDSPLELWFKQALPFPLLSKACITNAKHQGVVIHFLWALCGAPGSCLGELAFTQCDGVTMRSLGLLSSACPHLQKISHSGWGIPTSWTIDMLCAVRPMKSLRELDINAVSIPMAVARELVPQVTRWHLSVRA